MAGLLSYLWRSPLDTLYKRAVGWRDANEPLWSLRRFLSSPRGGKAVAIGAVTWSIYEVADAGIRALAVSTESSAESPTLAPTALECGSALSLTLVVRSLSGERA